MTNKTISFSTSGYTHTLEKLVMRFPLALNGDIKEYNLYIDDYKKFHKYDDVHTLTDDVLDLLDKLGIEDQKDLKRRPERVCFLYLMIY